MCLWPFLQRRKVCLLDMSVKNISSLLDFSENNSER